VRLIFGPFNIKNHIMLQYICVLFYSGPFHELSFTATGNRFSQECAMRAGIFLSWHFLLLSVVRVPAFFMASKHISCGNFLSGELINMVKEII